MTDTEIISLIGEGKLEKAFNAIVDAYSERLYWHVRRFAGSHDDADDILQEIFMKIWAALPSFRGEARLFTWLWRVATNESLNFLRRQRLRAVLSFKSLSAEEENRIDDDPYFDATQAERLLAKAVGKLPPKQRMVFQLRYFEDLKYEEISGIMDTSVGSLKASYHIACEKVRAFLNQN